MEILIVSHRGIAKGIKSTAEMVLGSSGQIKAIELTEEGVEAYSGELETYLASWLTEEKMGLVFADIKGGTPYNQAELILTRLGLKNRAKVICGVNLPMVVDSFFREIDINSPDEMAQLIQSGRDGIDCADLHVQTASSDDE